MNSLHIVPKFVFNDIAHIIRYYQLDGIDLHDVEVSVDNDELWFIGSHGQLVLWNQLCTDTFFYHVSARDLISEALLVLG